MIADRRFTLDTNLLVYSIDHDAGPKHRAAKRLVDRAALADCWLTVQALGEFFHATTRKSLLPVDAAIESIGSWQRVFSIVAAEAVAMEDALTLVRDHSFSYWDALLLATARRAGCAYIFSEDMQDGREIAGLGIVDPFGPEAGAFIDRLVEN